MFWNRDLTLYNRHEDENTGIIRWYKHNLKKCFYKVTNNTVNVGGVQLQTNDNIIRIPEQSNFLHPHKWIELPNDKKSSFITLQSGDLIFLGDIQENIDEYTTGQRASDLITKYKTVGSMFVKSVNVNDFMPGKHYLIRGE